MDPLSSMNHGPMNTGPDPAAFQQCPFGGRDQQQPQQQQQAPPHGYNFYPPAHPHQYHHHHQSYNHNLPPHHHHHHHQPQQQPQQQQQQQQNQHGNHGGYPASFQHGMSPHNHQQNPPPTLLPHPQFSYRMSPPMSQPGAPNMLSGGCPWARSGQMPPFSSSPHFPTHLHSNGLGNFARTSYMSVNNSNSHSTGQSQRLVSYYATSYSPPNPSVPSAISNSGPSNPQGPNIASGGGFGLGSIMNDLDNEHDARNGNEGGNSTIERRQSTSQGGLGGNNSSSNHGPADSDTVMGNSDDEEIAFPVAPLQLPPPTTTGASGPSASTLIDNRVLPAPYHHFSTASRQQRGQPESQQVQPPQPGENTNSGPLSSSQQHHSQPQSVPGPPSYTSNQQQPRTQPLHSPMSASFHTTGSQDSQATAAEPFQQQLIPTTTDTQRRQTQSRETVSRGIQRRVTRETPSMRHHPRLFGFLQALEFSLDANPPAGQGPPQPQPPLQRTTSRSPSPTTESRRRWTASRPRHSRAAEIDSDIDPEDSTFQLWEAISATGVPRTGWRAGDATIRAHQVLRGQAMQKRAARSVLASMQSVDLATLVGDDRSCCICYNEFGVPNAEGINEAPLRLPKCKHIFGDHCIKKWFEEKDTCPYCRDKVPSERFIQGGESAASLSREPPSDTVLFITEDAREQLGITRRSPPDDGLELSRRRNRRSYTRVRHQASHSGVSSANPSGRVNHHHYNHHHRGSRAASFLSAHQSSHNSSSLAPANSPPAPPSFPSSMHQHQPPTMPSSNSLHHALPSMWPYPHNAGPDSPSTRPFLPSPGYILAGIGNRPQQPYGPQSGA